MKNFSKASYKSADAKLPALVIDKREQNKWVGGPEMVMEEDDFVSDNNEKQKKPDAAEESDFASLQGGDDDPASAY